MSESFARDLERRQLGPSGPRVNPVGIGTAAATLPYGPPAADRPAPPREAARAMLEEALGRGLDFIDTAPAYGESETIVGEATKGRSCVIATKLAQPGRGWARMDRSEAMGAVRDSVALSLRRLGAERLDMLQIHNADASLMTRGILVEALETVRDEGAVDQLGATVYGEQNALAVIDSGVFDAVQVAYNPLDRRVEQRVLPAARDHGVAVIARSILMRGILGPAGRRLPPQFSALSAAADRFRSGLGASWDQLPGAALAWSLLRAGISCVLIGPRTTRELVDLLDGAERFLPLVGALPESDLPDLPTSLLDPSKWPEIKL